MTERPADRIICCKNIETAGPIAFGPGCVVHPDCSIIAEGGPIYFGEFNIIEERVRIVNKPSYDATGARVTRPMHIGNYNVFEVGSVVHNSSVGSYNSFEHRSEIREGSVGSCCIMAAGVSLPSGTVVPDRQVVFGEGMSRPNSDMQEENHRMHVRALAEVLAVCLPKYNALQQVQR
jgi:dynactin-6